jgi:hypothetical protein
MTASGRSRQVMALTWRGAGVPTLIGAMLLLGGAQSAVAARNGVIPADGPAAALEPPRSVTVPFTLDHNRMTVDVEFIRPDGTIRPARAWVDTGSPHIMMTEALARDLGIDLPGLPGSNGAGKPGPPAPPMRLGGMPLRVEGIQLQAEPGDGILSAVRAETTLPASAFRQDHIIFDYPTGLLTVARPGVLTPRGVRIPCRVNAETGLFLVNVVVDGDTVQFGVDNGSAGTWVSNALVAKWETRHPDWPHATGAVGSANFFGFPFEAQGTLMRLPELVMGGVPVRDVGLLGLDQALFDWYSRKSAGPVLGFVGANVLRGFRVEIDFPNRLTYWEAGPAEPFDDFDIVGLTLRPEPDGWFIVGVLVKEGKPAVAGVLPGDRLIRVDSLDTASASMGTVVNALRGAPGSARRLIVGREGKRITIEATVARFP